VAEAGGAIIRAGLALASWNATRARGKHPQATLISYRPRPTPSSIRPALDLSRRKIALISPHPIKMTVDFVYVFLESSLCCASSSRQQDHSAKNERGSTDD
jgi:hypothetical protein